MTSLAKATPEWRGQAWPQFYEKWRERAKVTASFIKPNSRVLDLGCGSGLLRDYLPEGCTWHGYDIEPLSPDIRYIDLDAGEFPQGEYDYISLFVLAWLRDPKPCLKWAAHFPRIQRMRSGGLTTEGSGLRGHRGAYRGARTRSRGHAVRVSTPAGPRRSPAHLARR